MTAKFFGDVLNRFEPVTERVAMQNFHEFPFVATENVIFVFYGRKIENAKRAVSFFIPSFVHDNIVISVVGHEPTKTVPRVVYFIKRGVFAVYAVQTPQGFSTKQLLQAYERAYAEGKANEFTDESGIYARYIARPVYAAAQGKIKNSPIPKIFPLRNARGSARIRTLFTPRTRARRLSILSRSAE